MLGICVQIEVNCCKIRIDPTTCFYVGRITAWSQLTDSEDTCNLVKAYHTIDLTELSDCRLTALKKEINRESEDTSSLNKTS